MTFAHHYTNPRIPLWYRLFLYGIDHDGTDLQRGQLREALDPHRLGRDDDISRAIRHAERKGLLEPGSSAARLTLTHHDPDGDPA